MGCSAQRVKRWWPMTETIIRNKDDMWVLCEDLSEMDLTKPLVVTIKELKQGRSLSQNNTYWMWLSVIASETGHDKDELHTLFRRKFLTPEQRKVLGEDCWVLQSTTALSTAEMASYMDSVYRLAAEFGIQLPLPEDMAA